MSLIFSPFVRKRGIGGKLFQAAMESAATDAAACGGGQVVAGAQCTALSEYTAKMCNKFGFQEFRRSIYVQEII